jgi:hypothetical protein
MQPRFSGAILCCLLALATIAFATLALGQDIFVTPVPNAPFSATIDVQRTFVQPEGGVVQVKTLRQIARDSRGRIHNENRELLPIASSGAPSIRRIHLYDPETRISTILDPRNKTYWTMIVRHPPSTVPPAMAASPTGNALPASEFSKKEDLGMTEMEGLPVHGVRETQTVLAASRNRQGRHRNRRVLVLGGSPHQPADQAQRPPHGIGHHDRHPNLATGAEFRIVRNPAGV